MGTEPVRHAGSIPDSLWRGSDGASAGTAAQLATMIANLDGYIQQQAALAAEPRVQKAFEDAAAAVLEAQEEARAESSIHEARHQRDQDVINELRRRISTLERERNRYRRLRDAAKGVLSAYGHFVNDEDEADGLDRLRDALTVLQEAGR